MSKVKLTIITGMTLFVLICVYWALGRNIMIDRIGTAISEKQSQGYKVVHDGLSVGGFPLKFRARLAATDIASPREIESPWSIKADDWRLESMAFNPFKWTAVHRGNARVDMRGPKEERWLFDARPFNVDVTARAKMDGTLKAFDATATKLTAQAVIGTLPPIVAIDDVTLSAAPLDKDMRFTMTAENIFLEKDTLGALQKVFGPRIEELNGSAFAVGLTSLDSLSLQNWTENGVLTSEDFNISWGGTVLHGGFNLKLAESGINGVVRITVNDISNLIAQFETASVFSPRQARNATLAASLLPTNEAGGRDVTLSIRDNYITLFGQKIYEL